LSTSDTLKSRGPIGWMVNNRVTPNILMAVLLLGGLVLSTRIKKEVFPEFDLDIVTVQVAYPGASPAEVEQGIVLAVEEAVRGTDGVEEINATASEGFGMISVELIEGADRQKVYQDIQQEVDRIRTFPEDAEEPQVSLVARRRGVLTLQLYGEATEWALRDLAEQVRDRLLQDPDITQIDLQGARDFEIRAEIPQESLRSYNLTLDQVARRISASAVEIPGGSIRTEAGEILMRVDERRDWAREFEDIPILTSPDGTVVTLGDIGRVKETFRESNRVANYGGARTIGLSVSRIGDQTPTGVSDAVRQAMEEIEPDLPPGVYYAINNDRSEIYQQRLSLLMRNAFLGLILVFCILGLFLEFKLAFWVTMGIPISFLGAFLFLPGMEVSINMISMFAFIIALGIVVDDAIIAGENIYEYRQRGMSFTEAAIQGARDVSMPITFSILTNLVAFMPLMFVPGMMGKVFQVIPLVVSTVFLISWVESLFILPAHLAHSREGTERGLTAFLHRKQQAFSNRFSAFVNNVYAPFLDSCIRSRYLTTAVGIATLILIMAYALSGRMGIVLMPKVESDSSVVTAVLPYGSPLSKAEIVRDRLVGAVDAVAAENGGDSLITGVFATIDESKVEIFAYLTDPEMRPISTSDVTRLWRQQTGSIAGLESLRFESDRGGPGSGASITIELSHRDIEVLDRASTALAEELAQFSQTKDIDDGYTPGKRQLNFQVSPEGYGLGLTAADIARQVRYSFYGAEALRQQRGRSEVRVFVSLPKDERASQYDVEQLLIRTPSGKDVPLRQVASVVEGRAYTAITRRDGRRTVSVTSGVEPVDQTSQVLATVKSEVMPRLQREYPGLSWGLEGRQAEMGDSISSLLLGFGFAMLGIYVLLSIPFRSYAQPLIVMMAVPFGIFGAIIGHLIMGYSMSVISMMGIVALSGVVVNDALVMINYANKRREGGDSAFEAIHNAGVRRFRPILLTTLTTFGGLSPMIFETSRQARFMIPMALSLGYGIIFATAITLLLVPCLYMILEDALKRLRVAHRF
jgi:multidrug efflux pump subunit AcrB